MGEKVRIQKYLSACGVASRRAAERMIVEGRVIVNGRPVTELGTAIDPERDAVKVDGKRVHPPRRFVYLAVHKPRGYVSTVRDVHAVQRVTDLAPPELAKRVKPVGRLDKTSEGLMLLTDDGRLIFRLTHPRYHVEKEYHVSVIGPVSDEMVRRLREGVELDDGPARALEAKIVRRDAEATVLQLVLGEGRKRQVRRMIEALGAKVRFLRRDRVGPIHLARLRRGEWRHLTKDEVRALYEATGLRTRQAKGT